MNIGFFVRHFTERGTEVAVYDYANYNETILKNKSYIICFTPEGQARKGFPQDRISFNKFKTRFEVIEINDIYELKNIIKKYNLSFFYTLTHGGEDIYEFNNKELWGNCRTIKHCVFLTTCPESDFYITIGNHINEKHGTYFPIVPHIVDLPDTCENLKSELDIPDNVFIIGRYGGFCEFDIKYVHEAIKECLERNSNIYFLFLNTRPFYTHSRIKYIDLNTDSIYKVKFINTCDVMIHARSIGETFGLSVAEFSSKNKPIITCECGDLEHIKILGDKAIVYKSKDELVKYLLNIENVLLLHSDWNCYRKYTPEYVMGLFKSIIFDKV